MKVEGVPTTVKALALWHKDVRKEVRKVVRRDVETVVEAAKRGPFQDRTGKLRDSIRSRYTKNRMTGYIEVGLRPRALYAQYVEFGPSRGPDKGSKKFAFLYPAFYERAGKFRSRLRRAVRKALKKAGAQYRATKVKKKAS
jgi:hypothetical protein